jgi:DNA segregation ATPase FtsK/SpoIIIE-like protein
MMRLQLRFRIALNIAANIAEKDEIGSLVSEPKGHAPQILPE